MTTGSAEAINDAIEAAKYWGWQSDAGSGSSVTSSQEQYSEALWRLISRVRYLEKKAGMPQSKVTLECLKDTL